MRRNVLLAALWLSSASACAEAEELDLGEVFPGGAAGTGTRTAGPATSTVMIGAGGNSGSTSGGTATGAAGVGGANGAGATGGSASGTVGTGGAASTDAATGNGGRGGASADAAVDRPVIPTTGFSVLYRTLDASAMAPSIQAEVTINDAGPDTVALSELTLRYYFTNELVGPGIIDTGFSGLNPGFHDLVPAETKQVVPIANPTFTADNYVEFGFTAAAGSIGPAQSVIISWQYHGPGFTPTITQSNDYSFDPTKTTAVAWERVVLTRGGNVIWGTPP
jgi:cellulose 1,4-beta-cellobiosidase